MGTCCLKTLAELGALRARAALETAKAALEQAGEDGGDAMADYRRLLEESAESLRDAEGTLLNASDLADAWLCPPAGGPSGAESCQQLLEERAVGLPGHPCRPHLQPLEDGGLVQLRAQWLALQKQEESTPALQAAAAYADALERKLSGGS